MTGTAGAGTTTTLMRTATRLVARDRDVRFVAADHAFDGRQLSRYLRGLTEPVVIVIDDADAAAPLLAECVIPELAKWSLEQVDAPIRLLLLARTADSAQGWYKTLHRAAKNREDELFPSIPILNGQSLTSSTTVNVGYVPGGPQQISVTLQQNGQTVATGSGSMTVG